MNAAVPSAVLQASAEGTLTLQVRSIRMEAEGIHAFELVDPNGLDLPVAEAGAHVDVHLSGGLVRSYSLAGDPANRRSWLLGVLREPKSRGGSRAMHEKVRVGDLLVVGQPRQAFALNTSVGHTVLLGGGIGITPIKAMAHALAAAGKAFDLHYCARTAKHAAFLDELKAITPEGHLHVHHDNGDPAQGLDIAALLKTPEPDTQVYYCGPGGFMKACATATAHWPAGTVHCEHFKAPEPSAPAQAAGSFEVRLAKQGVSVQVAPDQTIVRAIELAGLRVPTSCLSGLCGACKVDYLEGEVEHNDYILTDDEKQRCLTVCVSRAKSPSLVLDL